MSNNKKLYWFRGLFTLIAKEDPTFELIKNNTDISANQVDFSIDSLSTTFTQLPAQRLDEHLTSFVSKLESAATQSETSRKIVEKIRLHLAHQVTDTIKTISKAEIDKIAQQLFLNRDLIDDQLCSSIAEEIKKLLEPNQCPPESLLIGAVKLTVLTGSKQEAVAYLKRHANTQKITISTYLSAVDFKFHLSSSWTLEIWQSLFKKNKPSHPHDLFFKLLPSAAEIEEACTSAKLPITPNIPLTTLNQVAANLRYQDDSGKTGATTLFFQHNVTKAQFDEYKKLVIIEDDSQIPNITIHGNEISEDHSPFSLTKLDKREPIAAVIGDMTGCCEGIHKAGSHYVNFALTHHFAGYYVLRDKRLKKRDGIIAHCIAWRVGDDIVYSSVETNINYRNHLTLVADFFYMLASKLMVEHGIKRVYIWEWHDHTPPFLGLRQEAPFLNEKLKDIVKPLKGDIQVVCIADISRPHITLYSGIRKLPVLAAHFSEIDQTPFTNGELHDLLMCLIMSTYEFNFAFLSHATSITENSTEITLEQIKENTHKFFKIVELIKSNPYSSEERLSLTICLNIMKTSDNSHKSVQSLNIMDAFTLMMNASQYYHWVMLINDIYRTEYFSRGLTTSNISEIAGDFFDQDHVIIPFESVEIDDNESINRYTRKFFDFCLLILEIKDVVMHTPLDRARFNQLYDLICKKHPITGIRILRDAIKSDNGDVIDAVLQNGINLNEHFSFPETPLVLAIQLKKIDFVIKLIRYGADPNLVTYGFVPGRGQAPLEVAAIYKSEDIFKQLIIEGANPNFISQINQINLLHYLHHFEGLFWVSYLVARGVNINHVSGHDNNIDDFFDISGITPLYKAASSNKYDLFRRMLKNGADIDIQNKVGNTMLHVAVARLKVDAVAMFVNAGADLTIKNHKGETAYDLAKSLVEKRNPNKAADIDAIFQTITKAVNKKPDHGRRYSPKLFNIPRTRLHRHQALDSTNNALKVR